MNARHLVGVRAMLTEDGTGLHQHDLFRITVVNRIYISDLVRIRIVNWVYNFTFRLPTTSSRLPMRDRHGQVSNLTGLSRSPNARRFVEDLADRAADLSRPKLPTDPVLSLFPSSLSSDAA